MAGNTTILGLDEDIVSIKERLTGSTSELDVISISGMGGIGKTTLASIVYNDPDIMRHFDIHAWITISQRYHLKAVLLGILNSIHRLTDDEGIADKNDWELAELLYREVKNSRFLIVMDDMWSIKVWDEAKRCFPDDRNGSRIIVTTRLKDLGAYIRRGSCPHEMGLLSTDQSLKLLNIKVFGSECCPPDLEKIGWEIAGKCRGLPLAVIVIAGLLSRMSKTPERWKLVADDIHSHLSKQSGQCLDLLALSYNHLPQHLKSCFLYLGVFPEDFEIPVSKLLMLWIAEGFIDMTKSKGSEEAAQEFLEDAESKNLEDVAEEYLEDLVARNLVFVRKRGCDGGIKTCVIHDLLRDLILREAEKDDFLYVARNHTKLIPKAVYFKARAAFPYGCNLENQLSHPHPSLLSLFCCLEFNPFLIEIPKAKILRMLLCSSAPVIAGLFIPLTKSLLCFGVEPHYSAFHNYDHKDLEIGHFKMLTVVDVCVEFLVEFPDIEPLCNLRYLSISVIHEPELTYVPGYVSEFLQALIIRRRKVAISRRKVQKHIHHYRPVGLGMVSQLRHLHLSSGCSGPFAMPNLQTLGDVDFDNCGIWELAGVPCLKKLIIRQVHRWGHYAPGLKVLRCLENLKFIVNHAMHIPFFHTFPETIKKLTLVWTRRPWNETAILARSLPKLEVLKLKCRAFQGPEWELTEEESSFPELKSLLIDDSDLEQWEAIDKHFPKLETLILRRCVYLERIPDGIGDILSLKLIEVFGCTGTAEDSAKDVVEQQRDSGNDGLVLKLARNTA